MALISLSEWLDRHGDAPSTPPTDTELASIRMDASDAPAPVAEAKPLALRVGWPTRVARRWRRAFWRLRRQAGGHA